MSDATQSTAVNDQIVTQWQTIISTQMHFNDMILRTRAIGSSVVLAVYGYAVVALVQYPNEYLTVFDQPIHISVVVICFALSLLFSIFLMDVTYYYRLLLGMIAIGAKFENDNSSLIDQTNQLGQRVSLWWANCIVGAFYLIPATVGGTFLWYVFTNYPPKCAM